jgi:hypothetical protein
MFLDRSSGCLEHWHRRAFYGLIHTGGQEGTQQ